MTEYISVKQFAELAGVSTQYIYKQLQGKLKPYSTKINNRVVIDKGAVDYIQNGFPEMQQEQSTNATDSTTDELLLLRELNAVLKQENEELRKDKETLLQQLKLLQGLISVKNNKFKLLATKTVANEVAEDKQKQGLKGWFSWWHK